MKKITIFALHLQVGGIEKAIANFANVYDNNGYQVQIYCTYPMGIAYQMNDGIQIEYLMDEVPNRNEFKDAIKRKNPVKILREGIKAIRILVNKKRLLKKKLKSIDEGVVMTTRHEDNILLAKYGSASVQKVGQLHHDVHLYPSYVDEYAKTYVGLDQLVVLTKETQTEMAYILKDTDVRVVCIPNMIDYPSYEPDYDNKENICLAVGRLHPVKGFDRLIDIFAKVPTDWTLQIVGGGDCKESLENQIQQLGKSSNIKLLGEKNTEDLSKLYAKSSIYCMSSHSEGQGLVLLEAMSHGNALIAFDVRVGPASIMLDQQVGYLVEDGNNVSYEKQLIQLINDKETRNKMQENARKLAKNYDEEAISKLWLHLIKE